MVITEYEVNSQTLLFFSKIQKKTEGKTKRKLKSEEKKIKDNKQTNKIEKRDNEKNLLYLLSE